jgi:catechol 2,3-dioxygenase-like lactoylglutathione lyase family enzyme
MKGTNFRHIGLVVEDLERSLDFYCQQLGFKIRSRQLEKGNYISTMLGFQDAQVETVKLFLEENGSMLELLHFKQPKATASEPKKLNSRGLTHFAITVGNLDRLHKELSSKGIQFVSSPTTTSDNYAKVAFCQDTEGNFLELVEVL